MQQTTICLFMSLFLSLPLIADEKNFFVPTCNAINEVDNYEPSMRRSMGKIYQSNDDWLFKEKELPTTMDFSEEAIAALADITQLLKSKGIDLIIAPIPHRGLVYPYKIPMEADFDYETAKKTYLSYVDTLNTHGITTISYSSMFNQKTPDLFYKRDFHWTTYGAEFAAKITSEFLKSLAVYEELSKSKFETVYDGIYSIDGSTQVAFSKMCDSKFPLEYRKRYTTNKIINDEDLFDESNTEEIVLLGTSMSANTAFNFNGFLSENLSVDVANHSVSGGNVYGAFTKYFSDDEYLGNPPKIIIWEFPYQYHKFIKPHIYSFLIPKLKQSSCENIALETKSKLTLGNNHLVLNGGKDFKFLKHKDIFYKLEFDKPNIFKFETTSHYIERRQYKSKNETTVRLSNNGEFIVDLSHIRKLKDLHFLALDLNVSDSELEGVSVTTKICYSPKT